MRIRLSAASALLLLAGAARPEPPAADPPAGFDAPEVILDGSEIDRRLAPAFADVDGDGVTDLLVGIPNRLLVYRNEGTDAAPAYAPPAWLDATVPTARIPKG